MPRNVRLAVAASFVFHGIFILAARYRLSYDAYNHMFFGDHYRMDWWSLWEPRWYTGFPVTSYPPLVHQLVGAWSHLIGLDAAFALVLWVTVTVLPLAVYAFARIFVGKRSADYAAIGAAVLPSVYLTAHIFGQLPTLAATVTALFGMAALHRYLSDGEALSGVLTVSLLSTVMAFHHGTLLLLPWLGGAVFLRLVLTRRVKLRQLGARLLIVGACSVLGMLVVIWPFWEWGRLQSIQVPIDHASRHNFFEDLRAALIFFLPVYGPLLLAIPVAVYLACRRRLVGLALAFLMLFLLGLGSTTPLPRIIFNQGWEWLTYDRFAFWASLTLLPLFGVIISLWQRRSRDTKPKLFGALAVTSLIVGSITTFLPLQPGAVDMDQIVGFLKQSDHSRWRYLTFGFGDQLALLSTLSSATTLDGSYHTARTLPELRTSGIGQIDSAFWLPDGLSKLDPILQRAGEHGVRWGFVNVSQYIPVLERHGWTKLLTLNSGVEVWENPHAVVPESRSPSPASAFASFSWGTLPMLSLVTSLSLGALRVWYAQAEKILRGLYAVVTAFLPASLGFWYYATIAEVRQDRIYFTYTDALFFLSDALMLLAVILWLSTKVPGQRRLSLHSESGGHAAAHLSFLPAAFLGWALLSVLWSGNSRTALYVVVHLALTCLFVLSLRDWPHAWRFLLPGLCVALTLQCIAGITGFLQQSTAFLAPLDLQWPGTLDPSVRGAVIVELPDGESFLRAYGTLPHPNILGGLTLVLLLGPVVLFLCGGKPGKLALPLLIAGTALLALTFSRSAWLALTASSLFLAWKSRYFDRELLTTLFLAVALSLLITLIPYRELVQARTVNTTSHAEEFSLIGRAWLNGEAIRMIREHPLTGVGIGSFIIELARGAGEGYVIEPAHNLFLLAGAELGIPGLLIVLVIAAELARKLIRARQPNAILAGALLIGLAVTALFDHYLWTLAPGRTMLGLAAGLFLGQDANREA